jgi:hypothetical protein
MKVDPDQRGPDEAEADALRQMRIDHREMRDELSTALDESERAGRTLDEVALEYLYRGDSIRVAVGERSWTGTVVHVGPEIMILRVPAGAEVDLAYEAVTSIRVVERARSGGRSVTSRHPETMLARLRELANSTEEVEIGGPRLQPGCLGRIEIVARTHVEFRSTDGAEWILPIAEIGYLIRQASSEPR